MAKKLAFHSDKQVMDHIRRNGPEKAEGLAHERKETKGFEKAEHRMYPKAKSLGGKRK